MGTRTLQHRIVQIGKLPKEPLQELLARLGQNMVVLIERAVYELAFIALQIGLFGQQIDVIRIGRVPTDQVGIRGDQFRHHGREIDHFETEQILFDHLDAGDFESGPVGGQRGQAQLIVLRGDGRGLDVGPIAADPVHGGHIVEGMNLDRREQIGRVRAEIGRHQSRGQHLVARHEILHRQHRRDAEHQDDRDLILEEQLFRADRRLDGVELVVVRDDFDAVFLAAHIHATRGVDLFDPNLDAVEARQAPAGGIAGQRREEADLDGIFCGENLRGRRAESGQTGGDAARFRKKFTPCDSGVHGTKPPMDFVDLCILHSNTCHSRPQVRRSGTR